MGIQCSAEPQITVRLTFDDNSVKTVTVGKGDLVDVEYNKNGVRRRIEGKIVKISTSGTQSVGWCIVIDGSGDFAAQQARITPSTILDIDIISKSECVDGIESPKGKGQIIALKEMGGRLYYTKNGYDWLPVLIDRSNVVMEPGDGPIEPIPFPPHPHPHHHGIKPEEGGSDDGKYEPDGSIDFGDDEIKDEVY